MARNANGVTPSRRDMQDVVNNVSQILPSVTVDPMFLFPSRLMNIVAFHHIRTAQMIEAGMFTVGKEGNFPCQVFVKIKSGV